MSSKIVIKNCHQKLSSKIVIKNCHQKNVIKKCHEKLSSKNFIKKCHKKMSSKIVIKNCYQNFHQKLSSKLSSKIVINKMSSTSLLECWKSKVAHSLSESVSDKVAYWAVRWQLKRNNWISCVITTTQSYEVTSFLLNVFRCRKNVLNCNPFKAVLQ